MQVFIWQRLDPDAEIGGSSPYFEDAEAPKRAAVLCSLAGGAAASSRAILLPSRIAQGPEPCIRECKDGSRRMHEALRQNNPSRRLVLENVQHQQPVHHQTQKYQTRQEQLVDLATSGFML